MRIFRGLTKGALYSLTAFFGYHSYRKFTEPAPYDFGKKEGKKIVIVGSGMVGLTTAYYCALNPLNKVLVLDQEPKSYQHTSAANGCWLPRDFSKSWVNKPLYPYVYRALFDYKEFVSRIYWKTVFDSVENLFIISKFALLWGIC